MKYGVIIHSSGNRQDGMIPTAFRTFADEEELIQYCMQMNKTPRVEFIKYETLKIEFNPKIEVVDNEDLSHIQ